MHHQSPNYSLRHSREYYEFGFSPNARRLYEKRTCTTPNRFAEECPLQKNPNNHALIASFINFPAILQAHIKSLVKVRVISITDHRRKLWGQNGLFSLFEIPANTLLGIYTGIFMTEAEYTREYDRETVDAPNPISAYAMQTDTKIVMDGRKSNELSVMNATTNYKDSFKQETNVKMVPYIYQGWHYAVAYTIKKIPAGEELLWDYGANYWDDPEEKLAALTKAVKLKHKRTPHQATTPYTVATGKRRYFPRLCKKNDSI